MVEKQLSATDRTGEYLGDSSIGQTSRSPAEPTSGLKPKKTSTLYEVQTYTLFDGWVNCWGIDGELEYFETEREAQAAIDEHIDDAREVGMWYTQDEFRIAAVDIDQEIDDSPQGG